MFRQKLICTAALLAALNLVACGDGDDIIIDDPGDVTDTVDLVEISGDLTQDTTLTADNEYLLLGRVGVPDGITLTIEPGVKIRGSKSPVGWLQVQMGGVLNANGEATQPIVFTSSVTDNPQRGDWGGVVLLGKATNNVGAAAGAPGLAVQAELEGDGGSHGGSDDADSSGSLKYVRIEFAGIELSPDNELNGLTLGSVGSGTMLDYIQVHYGLDDGIEWFGGTANAKHLVVSGTGDDCFDTDEGFRGTLQYLVCLQATGEGDAGLEASSTGSDNLNVTPRANVKIANYTFVGRGEYADGSGNGLVFKDGTAGLAANGIVMNFVDGGLDIDHAVDSEDHNADDTSVDVVRTIFYGNKAQGNVSIAQFTDDADVVTEQTFAAETSPTDTFYWGRAKTRNNVFADPKLGSVTFESPNLLPQTGSPALDAAKCPSQASAGFEAAAYCGAFNTENWMEGWTRFSTVEDPTVGAVAVSGDIAANTTWTKANKYLLVGKVAVLDGATLTIEAGTQIFASKEPMGWLQINRGAKINAVGTAAEPIVFTSSAPEGERARGDWAGIVILGKALNNLNDANTGLELEGDGGIHGGANDGDDSGTLKYVRVEFAGLEFSPDNELNGITFGSVGSATDLEYVQVHMGQDDAFEFFGGSVNGKHLVATGTDDDCFDTDEGYNGKLQFLVCVHASDTGDNGLEASNVCDSGCDLQDNTPRRAQPQIANFTFVGHLDAKASSNGLRFKDGTDGVATNGIVMNFRASGLDMDHYGSGCTNVGDGSSPDLSHIVFHGNKTAGAADASANIGAVDSDNCDEQTIASGIGTITYANPNLPNVTLGSSLNLVPASDPAGCGANPGTGFEAVTYCGAFDGGGTNWMSGWTNFSLN